MQNIIYNSSIIGTGRSLGRRNNARLQGEMSRPGDLLLERELRVEPELLVLGIQINPLADLPDDVAAPLGRAEDEVRGRHRQDGAGRGPVVGIDERGEEEVEGGGEGVGEDGGEAVAGGEVEHLDPAVAGVALVPGALPQRHLRPVCVLPVAGAAAGGGGGGG